MKFRKVLSLDQETIEIVDELKAFYRTSFSEIVRRIVSDVVLLKTHPYKQFYLKNLETKGEPLAK